ncbi:hypothetical protein DPMN_048900 [Dreissena polymorpha]|uniref:Uncharacterized protein n=1 Tax=Dreissena polymorpha TaxID=45954 RepID=A0A9D4I2R3_DREPO|nr:hypothetical protein DPMN_048900 [Dreissena polymorpha]
MKIWQNVTSRVFTCFHYIHIEKNAPPSCGHVFSPIWTILKLVRGINKTNVLPNFHDDWAKIVTCNVFTRKTAPPTVVHVFQRTGTTFKLNQHIIKANILTKFHENWAKNVTSIVFTCFHYIHLQKNAMPNVGHVFSPIWTIFELVRDFNKTNVLTDFHDDWAKIVTFRVFTSENCHYIHIEKNAPPKLVRGINKTNVLPYFHDDWAKIVTCNVFTRKTAPPTVVHVFQRTGTTFKLNQHIIKANILTKFHENWAKNVTSRVFTCFHYIHLQKNALPNVGHVFSPIWTIFELVRDFIKTNVLTDFHDDWAKIVTSRVFTSENCHYIHIEKNAPPTGGHVFSPIWTIFELVRDINKTNVLTNFHDDWAKLKTAPLTGGHVFQRTGTTFELIIYH